jgi:hypothetical protein
MKKLVLIAFVAGCHFGGNGIDVDGAATDDMDVSEMGVPDGDTDMPMADLPPPPDLHRIPPDGVAPRTTGFPCDNSFECDSGFCIDGVCCEEFCDPFDPSNLCKACNVPGFEGRCVLALADTDPRGQCDQDPASSCGRDGLCDGAGHCSKWNAGTVCAGPSCSGETLVSARSCDGNGTCLPAQTVACAPYVCLNGTSCDTSCAGTGTCASGYTCTMGTCGKRGNGQACSVDDQCTSNFCRQGVCCGTDCAGTCRSCNLPWAPGTCTLSPAGIDPLGQCAAEARSSCGRDGQCDGAGACRLWRAGTPCAGPTCTGDDALSSRTCDGAGSCQAGTITDCVDYSCNPALGQCYRNCSNNMQCAAPAMCKSNGKCM